MSSNSWLFALILPAELAVSNSLHGQDSNRLVGRWVASVPAEEGSYIIRNGDTIRFKGRPSYNAILSFRADNHGFLRWGDSAKAHSFVYRLVNSKRIEMTFAGRNIWKHTFTVSRNALYLGEYPIPKKPHEFIDILYTLTFVKQP